LLYFHDLLYDKEKQFNPKYSEAKGLLTGQLHRLQANIFGNREFLAFLRNEGKFFCADENRELDLKPIDYKTIENTSSRSLRVRKLGQWLVIRGEGDLGLTRGCILYR
jgi:hypothetical protein